MKTETIDGVEFITDDIGGIHSEGLGWNPNGVFCGECSNMTCERCPEKDANDDIGIYSIDLVDDVE